MWMSVLLPALLGLVIIFIPGLLVVTAARVKGFDAFAISPAVSVALVSISAILAPMLGIKWALWVPYACAAVCALFVFLLIFSCDALGLLDAPSRRRLSTTISPTPMSWSPVRDIWHYLAWAIAAVFLLRNMTNALGRPEWVSQTWDNIFHLNAVRYIAEHENGSSLFIANMTSGGGPTSFYPAVWHDIVSLVFMHSDASIPAATNAIVLIVSACVWPLSIIYMVRNIFSAGRFSLLLTGVVAASLPAYPYLLTYFGVLYPNLLGYALLPVGIGMLAQLFRAGLVRYLATAQSALLGIFVALGTALAHPNAIMSLLVLALPIFATRIVLQIIAAIKRETPWWVAGLQTLGILAIFAIIYYLWGVVRPPAGAGEMWHPDSSPGGALGELLSAQALVITKPLWLVVILFLLGAYYLVAAKNRLYWIFGTWGVLAFFYIAVRSLAWEDGRYDVVGVWYNDAFRLAALAPVVILLFVAYGAQVLALKISLLDTSRVLPRVRESPKAFIAVGAVALATLAFSLQTSAPLQGFIEKSFWKYAPDNESELLSPDEENVLERVDDIVPENEKIVVQAFNGGPLAYALADREVTAYHVLWTMTDDENYIYQNLNQANNDPKVCEILNRNNLHYYLDFGHIEVNGADHTSWYPGFKELTENGVTQEVYHSGDAKLYKITACS